MPGEWHSQVADLAELLRGLPDGGVVTVQGPRASARPAPSTEGGLIRRLLAPAYVEVAPWIRLQREEDHLRGWCVGPGTRGRGFPVSFQEQEAILALGWHRPGPLEGTDYLRWWPDDVAEDPYLRPEHAYAAAEQALRTLRDVFAVAEGAAIVATAPQPS